MAHTQHTPPLQSLEESITVLFCLVDDAYARLNPHGERYGTLKKLSDSEILTLALFQQLRGVESERSFCGMFGGSLHASSQGWPGLLLPPSTGG